MRVGQSHCWLASAALLWVTAPPAAGRSGGNLLRHAPRLCSRKPTEPAKLEDRMSTLLSVRSGPPSEPPVNFPAARSTGRVTTYGESGAVRSTTG